MRRELGNNDANMWGGEQPPTDHTPKVKKDNVRPTKHDEGSYQHPEDIETKSEKNADTPTRIKQDLTRAAIGYGNSPATLDASRLSTLL